MEIEGLREYFDGVAVACLDHYVGHITLAGGVTNPGTPRSEAESSEPYFSSRLYHHNPRWERTCQLHLEGRSLNTAQNITLSLAGLKRSDVVPQQVIICCDAVRVPKVWALARRLCRFPYEVVGVPRRDIHPNSRWWKQAVQAALYWLQPSRIDRDLAEERR